MTPHRPSGDTVASMVRTPITRRVMMPPDRVSVVSCPEPGDVPGSANVTWPPSTRMSRLVDDHLARFVMSCVEPSE